MAAGAGGEDVEDDFGPVHDPDLELALQVGSLHRRQLFIEDDERRVRSSNLVGHFLDLAFAYECAWVGSDDVLRNSAYHLRPGGINQPGQLFQMFGDMARVGRSLAWRCDEYNALNRIADGNQWSNRMTLPVRRARRPGRPGCRRTESVGRDPRE